MEFTIKTLDADNEPSSVHSYQYIPVVIKDGNTVELDIDRLRHMANQLK
jgi:flagellar basal body rod protein FlgB